MNRKLELMGLEDGDNQQQQTEMPILDNPDLSYLRASATHDGSSSTTSSKYGSPEESLGEEDEDNKKTATRRKTDSNSKRPWTREENDKLMQLVKQYGAKRWSLIAMHLPGRKGPMREGKSIRVASVTSSPVQNNSQVGPGPMQRAMNCTGGMQPQLSPQQQLQQQRGNDGSSMVDFERSNMVGSSLRQPTMVYPVNGGYSNGMGPDYSRPMSMTSSPCSTSPADDMKNENFDYVPMQATIQRLRSSSPGSVMGTPSPSTSMGMMNSPYGSPASHMQHQEQQQSGNYMMSGNPYANNNIRNGMYSGPSGPAQQYRQADGPPVNLSHKRILDVQGSQRDMWKNDSPVSVTAHIFRGMPVPQHIQQGQVSEPMAMQQSKPVPMPVYRQAPTMGHFNGMEQVWTDDAYL
uniref:Uncharacterized protein n=1 Tax=Phytophthora ramorum TaxID=164328 RepID=H3H284_PHYRM